MKIMEKKEEWKKFYFDGNQYHSVIDNKEQWKEVVEAYKKVDLDHDHLLKISMIKATENDEIPSFTYNATGITLGEWAKENNINLIF
jgi:hypothetical protein